MFQRAKAFVNSYYLYVKNKVIKKINDVYNIYVYTYIYFGWLSQLNLNIRHLKRLYCLKKLDTWVVGIVYTIWAFICNK